MLSQINQRCLTHFSVATGLNLGHALEGLVHRPFVGQQAVADLELFMFFWGNGRHQIQRPLIATVVEKLVPGSSPVT